MSLKGEDSAVKLSCLYKGPTSELQLHINGGTKENPLTSYLYEDQSHATW